MSGAVARRPTTAKLHPNHLRALEFIRDNPYPTLLKLAWHVYPTPGADKNRMRGKGRRLISTLSERGLATETWKGPLILTGNGKKLLTKADQ